MVDNYSFQGIEKERDCFFSGSSLILGRVATFIFREDSKTQACKSVRLGSEWEGERVGADGWMDEDVYSNISLHSIASILSIAKISEQLYTQQQ